MKNTFKLLLIVSIINSCGTQAPKEAQNLNWYKQLAHKIINESKKKNPNAKEIRENSKQMVKLALPILKKIGEDKQECSKFLNFVIEKAPELASLSLEVLERDYHAGAALPETKEHCIEVKELVIHPATVQVIAKEKLTKDSKEQIADELDEVLVHLEEVLKS